ncbi:uncharacterized protein LOC109822970 isoform X2 [Asparagus officinalis]|nr:uncharacterized protein LOC109822970 isoform X2 [Asparagus officinalis]
MHLSAMEAQGDEILESQWLDQVNAPEVNSPVANVLPEVMDKVPPSSLNKGKGILVNEPILNLENFKDSHNGKMVNKEDYQKGNKNFQLPILSEQLHIPEAQVQENTDISNDSIPDTLRDFPLDLVKQKWNGQSFFIERSTWEAFIGGKIDSPNSNSASDSFPPNSNQTPAVQSSTSVPPGFTKQARSSSSTRSVQKVVLSNKHRSFLKQASTSKKMIRSAKKG